ncbi:MAG: hypothetical protein AB9903_28765 [Vulcanimicrobiota bacterium]
MPKTAKKATAHKRPETPVRKKEEAPVTQSDAFKILSLAVKVEEWAKRHNLSFEAAIVKAFNDLVERDLPQEDALLKMLKNAPEDDEPFTDEERAEEEEGWRECQQGLGRPWSEVRKELAGGK